MISLNEFIRNTQGKEIDVPWGNGVLKRQCVSLVQQYINQCLEQPMKPRGNGIDWKNTYINEGLGTITDSPKIGDLIVYSPPYVGQYGHIAIYIDSNTMYDQNNGSHDNRCAGYGKLQMGGVYIRPNVEVIIESENQNSSNLLPIDEIAKKVINGDFGNGNARKSKLEKLGYNYNEVQSKVNEILNSQKQNQNNSNDRILELVKKTMRGDFGNGENRRRILGNDFDEVQKQINLNIKNKTTSWDKIRLY